MRDDLDHRRRRTIDVASIPQWRRATAPTFHYPAFVGKVLRSPPTNGSPGRYVPVRPVTILGEERESGSATVVEHAANEILVLAMGSWVPKVGDLILCVFCENRWVARIGGAAQPPRGRLLGCVCQTPPLALRMTVASGSCSDGRFHSCNIRYKPTPPELGALQLGASCYLSDESFPDPQTGDLFFYYMSCFSSVVRISRVFPSSIYGSPFLDSVIYFWTLGFPGNTCDPFLLGNGAVFAGGDTNCRVVVSE